MSERIIDLSLTLKKGMRGVDFSTAATIDNDGYNATNVLLYSHAGTHLDAPSHSIDGAGTVDKIDLHKCIGPALIIDMSHKGADSILTVRDFEPYTDRIIQGTRLLIRTDWDLHAGQPDYRTDFPRISHDLAQWFADKNIWLLGLETPSVASLQDREEMQLVHRIMLKKEIVIVECLTNLREIQSEFVHLVALPLKIEGCDGSPIRAIAIEKNAK